ncbi:MAG: hypothetical protein DWQ29_10610, partial [Planctomycetota bacterium]
MNPSQSPENRDEEDLESAAESLFGVKFPSSELTDPPLDLDDDDLFADDDDSGDLVAQPVAAAPDESEPESEQDESDPEDLFAAVD